MHGNCRAQAELLAFFDLVHLSVHKLSTHKRTYNSRVGHAVFVEDCSSLRGSFECLSGIGHVAE